MLAIVAVHTADKERFKSVDFRSQSSRRVDVIGERRRGDGVRERGAAAAITFTSLLASTGGPFPDLHLHGLFCFLEGTKFASVHQHLIDVPASLVKRSAERAVQFLSHMAEEKLHTITEQIQSKFWKGVPFRTRRNLPIHAFFVCNLFL